MLATVDTLLISNFLCPDSIDKDSQARIAHISSSTFPEVSPQTLVCMYRTAMLKAAGTNKTSGLGLPTQSDYLAFDSSSSCHLAESSEMPAQQSSCFH
ncbi:hypothetical protein ACOSP7_010734 [Xanthoceras sorbifolium]